MKKIVYISMGLLAILAISCSKKDSPVSTPADTAKQNLKEVSITVGAPEDIETKVAYAYDEAEKKLKLTWEEGDKIVLQNGSDAYTLSTTDNSKMATFTGSVPDGEGTYDVFYAGNGANAMTLDDVEAMDYSVQTQSANDNTSHLKFAARLSRVTFTPGTDDIYFTADWAQEKGGTYQQSGAIRIRLQNPGVTGVKSVTLTAPSAIFPKTNALNNNEIGNSIAVNLPNASIAETDHIVVYAMLPWNDAGIALPAGEYQVTIVTDKYDVWTKSKAFEANVLSPVAVNSITLNKTSFTLQPFYGGQGTAEDPYLIANARQFKNISTLAANEDSYLAAHYRQVEDISFNGDITDSMIGPSEEHPFSGTYVGYKDGAESKRKLRMLTITAADNAPVGIFRNVTGTIKHITVAASEVSGEDVVGALVGTLNGGTVSDCVHSGNNVTGSSKVGGLVGEAKGQAIITNCETQTGDTVNPGSANYVGGIVGYVTSAEVTNCVNMADVTGRQFVGGIAGDLEDGKIYACVNNANVTSNNTEAGGIVARIQGGTIRACYTSDGVLISGYSRIGGIAGYQSNQGQGASLIINCAAKSKIRSTNSGNNGAAGGLVGYMYSAADKGDVILTNSVALGSSIYNTWKNTAYLGAIVGQVNGAEALCYVRNCYSQHNSTTNTGAAVYYSSKSDGSTITNTKQTYMGGIYGNLVKGTVQNCYCVGADSANGNGINKDNAAVGAGSKGSDGLAGNTRMVKNAVKNGTATVNPSGWTIAYSQIKPTSVTSAYLVDIMNLGTWTDSGMTVRQSYISSEGTPEEVCEWVGLNGTSPASYDPAYPSELKQLGNKYYPN